MSDPLYGDEDETDAILDAASVVNLSRSSYNISAMVELVSEHLRTSARLQHEETTFASA